MSELTTKTVAEEAPKPTLADAAKELRTILAAYGLMREWSVDTMTAALIEATARVRGARERAGYERPD